MNRFGLLVLIATAISPAMAQQPESASSQTGMTLGTIKTFFVGPLGSGEGADLIRQKLINRLIKTGLIGVTESESEADAVLTGAAQIDKRHYLAMTGNYANGGTRISAQSVVRLVGKNKQILWTDELTSSPQLRAIIGACFGGVKSVRSASANVADKTVKDLCDAITADRKKVASTQLSADKTE